MFKIEIYEKVEYAENEQEYKKTADSGNQGDGGACYGYVTKKNVAKTRDRTVLKQEVEDLDLVEVIKAINGIE